MGQKEARPGRQGMPHLLPVPGTIMADEIEEVG
jgi:hypothetical protein